jgi:hypothetical protein
MRVLGDDELAVTALRGVIVFYSHFDRLSSYFKAQFYAP